MKVCAEPGCPNLTDTTRCGEHTRTRDQARGTRQQRGYGASHDKLRQRWARRVASGTVTCWRCNRRISPLEPFDLGHCDNDRSVYHGPEHQACNRSNTRGDCTHISHTRYPPGG